jgi:hypothetical protein
MAKSKKSAAAAITDLADKIAALTSAKKCPRLLHAFFGGSLPSVTPGCERCAEVKEQHDAWTKANPPKPATPPAGYADELDA